MKIKFIHHKLFFSCFLAIGLTLTSCNKFLEVDAPDTSVNEGNVYENDGTAISAIVGVYTSIVKARVPDYISYYPELSADNMRILNVTAAPYLQYSRNILTASDLYAARPWIQFYPIIFTLNAGIEGLTKSLTINPTVKQNLLGQAYFLRAFLYFYLTNFYGDVPLAVTSDYTVNKSLRKAPVENVYAQIIADLKNAQSMLPENYLTSDMMKTYSGDEQRVSANKYAATALLARVYLYQKDWSNAEAAASEVINKTSLYNASIGLDDVFKKNSKETILALQPVENGYNTTEAELYLLDSDGPTPNSLNSAYLSEEFMDKFQVGDQRKIAWINTNTVEGIPYPYPGKYKRRSFSVTIDEYSILLRLGEQYLIRAEARIQLNRVADAIVDLNVLRDRATDKSETDETKRLKQLETSLNKDQASTALEYERRVELFAEGAHRWFDLKRSGKIDAVMTPATAAKGGTWSAFKSLYPIPASEIQYNPSLIQNTGYSN